MMNRFRMALNFLEVKEVELLGRNYTWSKEVPSRHDPLMALHIKLSRVAKALSAWAKALIPQGRLVMSICKELIQRLEEAQEHRQLAGRERMLQKKLKARVIGLAAVQKSRARQKSRLTWLKKGDANTRYFQIMANVRKKKNFIHALHTDDWVAWSHSVTEPPQQ
jgi:vacuolar-type H+-ATPase catalytic subunit A/Vma1